MMKKFQNVCFNLNDASVSLKASLPQLVEVVQHVIVAPVHLRLACLGRNVVNICMSKVFPTTVKFKCMNTCIND